MRRVKRLLVLSILPVFSYGCVSLLMFGAGTEGVCKYNRRTVASEAISASYPISADSLSNFVGQILNGAKYMISASDTSDQGRLFHWRILVWRDQVSSRMEKAKTQADSTSSPQADSVGVSRDTVLIRADTTRVMAGSFSISLASYNDGRNTRVELGPYRLARCPRSADYYDSESQPRIDFHYELARLLRGSGISKT